MTICCRVHGRSLLRQCSTSTTNAVVTSPSQHWRSASRRFSKDVSYGSQQDHKGAHVGTVITVSASQCTLSELLRGIKPLNCMKTGNASLLLLLTPSYARHAQDPALVGSLLSQLHGGSSRQGDIDSIIAVVDALPTPTQHQGSTEGLAFVLQEDPAASSVIAQEPIRKAAQRAGSLNFDLDVPSQQRWRLQLPLAQTIFSTGLPSTLIRRRSSTTTSDEYLESLTFNMQAHEGLDQMKVDYPLVQLTSYRTVQNSMGNIVRTLSSHDGEASKEEPASRGLEEAVAAYFRTLRIAPEPVNVWALIIPRAIVAGGTIRQAVEALVLEDHALHELWLESRADSGTFRNLVERQARLVKVLSGGGGWGKKAGLLSLDPDLEYTTRELRDDHGWQFDFESVGEDDKQPSVERQLNQALGSSVEEGDGIVFFIAPKLAAVDSPDDARQDIATLSFGICEKADSFDEPPEGDADRMIVYREGFFGMCSETGMALQIRDDGAIVNKTKLEVPGLRVLLHATPVNE